MKRWQIVLLEVALGLLCVALSFGGVPQGLKPAGAALAKQEYNTTLRVLGTDPATQEIVMVNVIPVRLGFEQEQGLPPGRGLLQCRQENEQRVAVQGQAKFSYPVVMLRCEEGRVFILKGLSMQYQ